MKKLIITMMAVMFLITSVNVCLADKGRDPPDPPVIPPSGGPPR